jgi:uncharacterized protein (UPF0548 family)
MMVSTVNYRFRINGRRNDRWMLVVGFIVTIAIFHRHSCFTCDATPQQQRRRQQQHHSQITAPPFKRKLQSWLIRQRSQPKFMKNSRSRRRSAKDDNDSSRNIRRGSFMTGHSPNSERLFNWFGVKEEDPNQFIRCMMLRNEFNHNICGITNPLIQIKTKISQQKQQQQQQQIVDQHNRNDVVDHPSSLNSITQCDDDPKIVKRSWWPSLQVIDDEMGVNDREGLAMSKWRLFQRKSKNNNNFFKKDDWRVLVYRKRVGRGKECYQQVRDAALDWEFQSADGSMGMMEVPVSSPQQRLKQPRTIPASSRYSVQPIIDDSDLGSYSSSSSLYRSLGSRRLVSFSSKSLTGFLPPCLQRRIYAINPVMVVYDVVDQHAQQTLFTSTAYSTLKGHFIRGEERVTVALRDGSQDVEVEILSISRAGPSLFGKMLWPFLGTMQNKFFQRQLEHLSESGFEGNSVGVMTPVPLDKNWKQQPQLNLIEP